MLTRSRVTSSMDVQRFGQALARPGMDTRCWICTAAIQKFVLDDDHGPFADVVILSSSSSTMGEDGVAAGDVVTVRVGSVYAGPGFGFYAPLAKDDEVIVAFPEGNPDHGGWIVGRAWSKSDPPPDLAKDNNADVCLRVEKDKNLRIQVFGSGNVVLGAENGKVLLGDESGTKPNARKEDKVGNGTVQFTFNPGTGGASLSIVYTPGDGSTVQNVMIGSGVGTLLVHEKITEGSDKVESS